VLQREKGGGDRRNKSTLMRRVRERSTTKEKHNTLMEHCVCFIRDTTLGTTIIEIERYTRCPSKDTIDNTRHVLFVCVFV